MTMLGHVGLEHSCPPWQQNPAGVSDGDGATAEHTESSFVVGNWQQKSPSGGDGQKERVKGVEPSTFTLAT